jgi:uracil-DNA glycosylase
MKEELYRKAMNSSDYKEFSSCFESGCTRCSLCEHDNRPVLWRGNPNSNIVLIGESPGAKEDQKGIPFSGPAGQLLDKIMFSCCGLETQDIFLTNSTFCRPVAPEGSGKQNYTPKKDQIVRCWPFVEKLISIINPSIIIACGRTALCSLMGEDSMRIGDWEGKWLTRGQKNIFVMAHPAQILHLSNWPEKQREVKYKVQHYMTYFRGTYQGKL